MSSAMAMLMLALVAARRQPDVASGPDLGNDLLPGGLSVNAAVEQAALGEEQDAAKKWNAETYQAQSTWMEEYKEVKEGEQETKEELAYQLPPLQLLRGSAPATPAPAAAAAAAAAPAVSAQLRARAPVALPNTAPANSAPADAPAVNLPVVLLDTSAGGIALRVRTDKAPKSGQEFLDLVGRKLYDGCVFYRAESFVVQGGLRTASGEVRQNPIGPFALETALKNTRGTVALARWSDPTSATGEFFINLQDNTNLDATGPDTGFGVFAEVIEGMEVAEKISREPVHDGQGMHMLDAPVVIRSARAA